jgi:RHS repeat-associated protein
MIIDQTGSLANVKRHDYLPFGEELFTPTSGRNSTQGYSTGDGVRQQFTSKERDVETGLDYFINRYHSSAQGRFTSADPSLASGDTGNPQTWNRYGYVLNNPTRLVDRFGLDDEDPQDPAKKQPALVPCKPPKSVTITTGPAQIAAGTKLPEGDYLTGPVSIFSIEVKDSEGGTIKDGVTVQESAVPADAKGLDLIQNPHAMAPLANGIVPDYISVGETSKQPLDRNNPKEMEHAGNVIETALSKPITDTVRQTLTVSGCGTTLQVVNERTQTNIEPSTGNVRPYKQNGRLVNNYTYTIKAISGPLTVVNNPPK